MTDLWVERTDVRRYTGRSSRGAEVLIGSEDVEGVFTPGELLKIALAACSGMSSDHPLRSRLGLKKVRKAMTSGGPVADRALAIWERIGLPFTVSYSLAEFAAPAIAAAGGGLDVKLGAVSRLDAVNKAKEWQRAQTATVPRQRAVGEQPLKG